MADSSSSNQPQFSMQISDKRPEVEEFYKWLLQQKKDFHEDTIRFLAKMEKKRFRVSGTVKSSLTEGGTFNRSQVKEDYVPVSKNAHPLMDLESAIELADLVAMELDPVHSTTWTDPNIPTNRIASLFGESAGQMLDNPRYHFQGNETDAVAFTLMVCKTMQSIQDRSKGGLFMKEIAESTINYQTKNLSMDNSLPGVQMPKRSGITDTLFAPRKPNQ